VAPDFRPKNVLPVTELEVSKHLKATQRTDSNQKKITHWLHPFSSSK